MVLLHGLGENGSDWARVSERLSDSFQLIALDLRGHGKSDWPGEYSYGSMRGDVIGLIDHLRLGPVVIVGHSLGGVVAYLVAIGRPDLVTNLVIEDVTPPYLRDSVVPDPPADVDALDFDWGVVPAIVAETNAGAPQMWSDLPRITALTLLIGGGPASHIPQNKMKEVAKLIPSCDLVTIRTGHHIHSSNPEAFNDAVLGWIQG